MASWRLDIAHRVKDSRSDIILNNALQLDLEGQLDAVHIIDTYTIDNSDFNTEQAGDLSSLFINSLTQDFELSDTKLSPEQLLKLGLKNFDYLIEIGFLPGVTDNVGNTARQTIKGYLKQDLEQLKVYSSQLIALRGSITKADAEAIAQSLHNSLIQRASIWNSEEAASGIEISRPKVELKPQQIYQEVDLEISDDELVQLGKRGINNRGPLALDLDYMKAIQAYFRKLGRKPSDLELEAIAQTWSEHCKHTIFADPIDEIEEGLYKGYIKRATNEIRAAKAGNDFCVSVFSDNAGLIDFDDKYLVAHKVETHNSPSALDPFGGAITGIVGVNRDAIGCGLGTKPVANIYGYCFADPDDTEPIYRDADLSNPMLSPRRILDGVVHGVNVGGNCSGIPTVHGFTRFHPRYKGKPLVFVGTVGLVPKTLSDNRKAHEKQARPGDLIVVLGGRVGQDGIHGATFSSVEMDANSPATAVQIGDPITQKKFSDAIIKEARDLNLYSSITDNGAGGISCSIAEMAKEAGGCFVELDKAPLKYPGLEAWQIWVSESQERMTLAVPPENWDKLSSLFSKRDVEAVVVGKFTDSGKCEVQFDGTKLMDVELDFLHDGLPKRHLQTKKPAADAYAAENSQDISSTTDPNQLLLNRISSLNICSKEFISEQYDHEVQAGSVIKPLQGIGKVNGDASVFRPALDSNAAVVLSSALCPEYSEIDPYNMAATAIDTAIRNAIAAGASLDHMALLDNFCWCSANEPERLWQLKETARACYEYAVAYGTPYISGKDSMFNDFRGYDAKGNQIKISAPPTLLVSSIGVIDHYQQAQSIDFKCAGDLIYVLGSTDTELGAVPQVNALLNSKLYREFEKANGLGLIASAASINDGLAITLAKSAIAAQLGVSVNLVEINSDALTALYSDAQGRLLVSIDPAKQEQFESIVSDFKLIGSVVSEPEFKVQFAGDELINLSIQDMGSVYKERFNDY